MTKSRMSAFYLYQFFEIDIYERRQNDKRIDSNFPIRKFLFLSIDSLLDMHLSKGRRLPCRHTWSGFIRFLVSL